MNSEMLSSNESQQEMVFKPRLMPNFWLFVAWGTLSAILLMMNLHSGKFTPSNLIWLIISILFVWTALTDYTNDRWIIKGTFLENQYGKKNPVRRYDIAKMKSLSTKKLGVIKNAPWNRTEILITFVDRSQTKSIEPLSVQVKDYQLLLAQLIGINKNIKIEDMA